MSRVIGIRRKGCTKGKYWADTQAAQGLCLKKMGLRCLQERKLD